MSVVVTPEAVNPDQIVAEAERALADIARIKESIGTVIFGQESVIERTLVAVLAGGHALLVGVPGLAKTKLVETLGTVLGLSGQRIQFTPDLMPSDIIGSEVMEQDADGRRSFRYLKGPIFAQLLMADEINRASPRTQSALLQAMQEYHVTVAGQRYDLPAPFHVLATQNPLEQEGTYPLPEAQLDRFLIKISMGYPDLKSQISILQDRHTTDPLEKAQPVLNKEQLQELIAQTTAVHVAEPIYAYIANLAQATREHAAVQLGVSPRGALAVCRMAKAYAYLHGRDFVMPEDVAAIFPDVCAHRLMLNSKARMMEEKPEGILAEILKSVDMPVLKK